MSISLSEFYKKSISYITEAKSQTPKKKKEEEKKETRGRKALFKDNLDKITHIRDRGISLSVKLGDGKSKMIDPSTAHAILNIHTNVNGDNKEKIYKILHGKSEHFENFVHFCHGAHSVMAKKKKGTKK